MDYSVISAEVIVFNLDQKKGCAKDSSGTIYQFEVSNLAQPTLKGDLKYIVPEHCTLMRLPIRVGTKVVCYLSENNNRVSWVMSEEAYRKAEKILDSLFNKPGYWCDINFAVLKNTSGAVSYFPWNSLYNGCEAFGITQQSFYDCVLYKEGDKAFVAQDAITFITRIDANHERVQINENLGRAYNVIHPNALDGFYYRSKESSEWSPCRLSIFDESRAFFMTSEGMAQINY